MLICEKVNNQKEYITDVSANDALMNTEMSHG